jgi:serine/threonine protein kinase
MRGEQISLSADIYSLGVCIVQVVTRNAPWGLKDKVKVAFHKSYWTPEIPAGNREHEPFGHDGEICELVERMCTSDPSKRASITAIVYKFEQLADTAHRSSLPLDCEALLCLDDHLCGE